LISSYLARDIHIVRTIRNIFSHESVECTFDRPDIRDRVRALETVSDYNRRYPDVRATIEPPGTRGDFLGITTWMLYSLHREAEEIEPLREHIPEFGYLDYGDLPPETRKALDDAISSEEGSA
jgi:hypothetical protein